MSREKMEKRLRESDERYRLLLDTSPDGIWFSVFEDPIDITLPEAEIVRLIIEREIIVGANDILVKMYGFDTEAQLVGKHWAELDSAEYSLQSAIEMAGNHYKVDKHVFTDKDSEGNITYFEESEVGNIVDGKLVSCLGIARDITQRKKAEKELQRSEERYRSLIDDVLDNSRVGIFILDSNFKIVWVNHALESYFGLRRDNIIGKDKRQLIHEQIKDEFEDSEGFVKEVLSTYENNVCVENFECHILPGSGCQERWLEHWSQPIQSGLYAGGRVEHYTDITERKRREAEVRREKERSEAYLNIAGVMLAIIDGDENISLINNKGCETLGYKTEELMGRNWFDTLVPQSIRAEIRGVFGKLMAGDIEPVEYYENALLTRDGEERLIAFHNTVIRNPSGQIAGVLLSGEDITQRKKAEEKLRESIDRHHLLMDNSPTGIWFSVFEEPIDITLPEAEIVRLMAEREVIVETNDILAKMHGFDTGSQLIGKHWAELDSGENNLKSIMEMVRCHYRVDRCTFEGKDSEGYIRYFENSEVGNIMDGKLVSSFGLARDITGRKKMEDEKRDLEQKAQLASRLATVGEMASGIAHEINNPLTGVIGFSQLLSQREDIPEDIKQHLEIITEGSQRVASIVSRLLAFARQHKLERSYVDINKLLENSLELRAYEMQTSNIKLSTRLDSALPRTMADGAQLQQVFLNIIMNAETEMKEAHGKGKLLVKTEAIDDTIRISFKDDGPGISPENLGRLFEPFFTTREVGKGTGLGLSVCHGIIAEHNGRIYAKSKLGHGATFIVELPVFLEEKQLELDGSPADESRKVTGAKILVVDDEPITLQLLAHLLSGEGYDVESTGDAETALAKIKSERYNLILLDIKLPGMSGIELYKNMQKTARSLASRVVFITGDAMAPDTMSFLSRTKAPYISKPFDIKKLKQTIKRILAQS